MPHEVASLRPDVDFLIVSAHWGREFVRVPPQSVIDHAHAIAESGQIWCLGITRMSCKALNAWVAVLSSIALGISCLMNGSHG